MPFESPSPRVPESRLPNPESRLRQVHPHALDLRVFLERVMAPLAAEARLFVAAEGKAGIVEVVGVDPDRAGLESPGRAESLLDVARPDCSGEAVDRRVADRDRL